MTRTFRARWSVLPLMPLIVVALVGRALPLRAQTVATSTAQRAPLVMTAPAPVAAPRESLVHPFTKVFSDLRHLPSHDNFDWLVVGASAALAAHALDASVSGDRTHSASQAFRPGSSLGATPIQLGAAFATYAIGRASNRPRAMTLGSDLIRAQLLAEVVTTGVKQSVRRRRPEGSGFSFSSGHTAVSFASATVIQKHFGWKAGIPAYAVAGYVAASRVQMRQHYLSDVVFGAAVGVVSARTITVGHGVRVEPMLVPGGAGAMLRWEGRK